MKFLDLINEDEQSEWNKLFKKTQLVFKTLRKGRIRTKSGVVFSYEIPEDSDISVASSRGEEPTPYVRCESIKIKEESKECSDISYSMFGELIKRKFGHFGILFVFSVYPEDIEKYEPETINEWVDHKNVDSPDLNSEQLKDLKRAKTVFKALKSGKVKFELTGFGELELKYEIGDPYYYWAHISPDDIKIELNNITVHTTDPKLYQGWLNYDPQTKYSRSIRGRIEESVIKPNIRKRFKKLGLDVIGIDYFKIVLDEPQPINENDNEKLLKKARTVYKAYKHGKYKNDNQGQREDALFSYRLSDDPTIQIVQYYIDYKTIGTKVQIKCEIFTKSLNEVADWTKTDRMIKHIENNFKNHDIDIHIKEWTYNMEPYTKPTEPINEDTSDDEKRIKRARTIYKALKKGLLVRGEYGSIKYLLPDEYKVYVRSIDDVLVIRVGEEEDDNHVKFFFNDNDGTGDRPTKPGPKYYNAYVGKIWEKFFNNFDIKLIC